MSPATDEELRAGMRRELRAIRRERLPASWDDESRFREELGLDSLDLVEMVARLEQATGLFVPDSDMAKLTSVSSTAAYVHARRGEQAAVAAELASRADERVR